MTKESCKTVSTTAGWRHWRLFSRLLGCLAVVFFWGFQPAVADPGIEIILSAHTTYYDELADTLKATVRAKNPTSELRISSVRSLNTRAIKKDSLLVAIGTSATEVALRQLPHNPLLSLFVTESVWHNSIAEHETSAAKRAVVFINQPLDRALVLATLLKPEMKIVSTVFGPVSQQHAAELQQLAADNGLELVAENIGEQTNPLATLTPLIESSDLFLAIPDHGVFNRSIARWALYLSYKSKIPVIGFSRSYTQAGALASLLSSPQDIGKQGGDWLNLYIEGEQDGLWHEFAPQYFTLEINPSVARALDIQIASEEAIHQQLVERLNKDTQP